MHFADIIYCEGPPVNEKYIYSILARKERKKERKKEIKKEVTIHHTSLYPNTYMRQTILAHI